MKVVTEHQYDPDWWAARRGVPTASCADQIVTPKKFAESASQEPYIAELIAELFDPAYPRVNEYQSPAMLNGSEKENEAVKLYAFKRDAEVHRVGLCTDESGRFGFSPDSLVGRAGDWEGAVEAKNPLPKTHVKWRLAGTVPDEYLPQVHFTLAVSGLEWVDFVSNATGLPELIVRVTPNDKTDIMRERLEKFWEKYQASLQLIRDMTPPTEFYKHQDEIELAKVF